MSSAKRKPTTKAQAKKTERRTFQAHQGLILTVIHRQAGSLEKALLEAVMNSVDAGATAVDVELTWDKFTVRDDGRGFDSAESIEQFFEQFGQPHDVDEHGRPRDARYGTFRIGRGQMFTFAHTIWRSGKYGMDVDLRTNGLDYDLSEYTEVEPGCRIEGKLYSKLQHAQITTVLSNLAEMCAYVAIPVRLNGHCISQNPADMEWDYEDELFYYNYRKGTGARGVKIYNLGILTDKYTTYDLRAAGVVVTKESLVLNAARNDIMGSCPVWKKIRPRIKDIWMEHLNVKGGIVTLEDAAAMWKAIAEGSVSPRDLRALHVIPDCTGRLWSGKELAALRKPAQGWALDMGGNVGVALAPKGSQGGDKVMQAKEGFVLDEIVIDWMCSTYGETNLTCYLEALSGTNRRADTPLRFALHTLDELRHNERDEYRMLDETKYTKKDKAAIYFLQNFVRNMRWNTQRGFHRAREEYCPVATDYREVKLGFSNVATAWTDGKNFIVVNAEALRQRPPVDRFNQVYWANILIHELCHGSSSCNTHVHSPEFYQAYETLTTSWAYTMSLQSAWTSALMHARGNLGKVDRKLKTAVVQEAVMLLEHELLVQIEQLMATTPKKLGDTSGYQIQVQGTIVGLADPAK